MCISKSSMEAEFQKLATKLGYRLVPAAAMINGVWVTRPDIQGVQYHGYHVMTVPKRMYGVPNARYKTLEGMPQLTYYEAEYHLKNWDISIKRGNLIKVKDEKLRELCRKSSGS